MNVRRLQLDVDKAVARPDLLDLAQAISTVHGVEAVNITVTDIDVETMGTGVTIEGDNIDVNGVFTAFEKAGAALQHRRDRRRRPDHQPGTTRSVNVHQ
ncbi:DUF211 domain-containing protein [Humibacillus sp. DSM 29435]|uniref:DUF211 domain-containing protein n=1 Tax=Humibacillus sp. DSM 29435 TaxID=1869167 RepID=UPI000A4FBA10|nr:DUF211 domain-containing protein [Humibacillus sp. DSM 29435]